MRWLDVAGPPGCGKSTLCYPIWGDKSVGWDGRNPPAYWRHFIDELTNLMVLVQDHPSIEAVLRMNDRSAKKMATVERMQRDDVFIQTGLVQRILGFGWRLVDLDRDVNLIRRALWLMPVSVGVVFLTADLETILKRNKDRENDPATAHENRSYQVPLMLPAIEVAKEVLRERGVPVLELDVQNQSIDDARQQLVAFAAQGACDAASARFGCEVEILSLPPWWRRPRGRGALPMAYPGQIGRADAGGPHDRQVERVAG